MACCAKLLYGSLIVCFLFPYITIIMIVTYETNKIAIQNFSLSHNNSMIIAILLCTIILYLPVIILNLCSLRIIHMPFVDTIVNINNSIQFIALCLLIVYVINIFFKTYIYRSLLSKTMKCPPTSSEIRRIITTGYLLCFLLPFIAISDISLITQTNYKSNNTTDTNYKLQFIIYNMSNRRYEHILFINDEKRVLASYNHCFTKENYIFCDHDKYPITNIQNDNIDYNNYYFYDYHSIKPRNSFLCNKQRRLLRELLLKESTSFLPSIGLNFENDGRIVNLTLTTPIIGILFRDIYINKNLMVFAANRNLYLLGLDDYKLYLLMENVGEIVSLDKVTDLAKKFSEFECEK